MKRAPHFRSKSSGFSLVELTTVVVILGVLSMMAVPRYRQVVERAKCVESFTYLAIVQGAQERHNARTGEYARSMSALDVDIPTPTHFRVGNFTSFNWQTLWQLRLIRDGASSGYGDYSVTWNQDGFYGSASTVDLNLAPAEVVVAAGGQSASGGSSSSRQGGGRDDDDDDDGKRKKPKKEKKPKKGKSNNGKHLGQKKHR